MNMLSFKKLKEIFLTFQVCCSDLKFMLKNSPNIRVNTEDKLHVNIMLGMHSLEKGMSFNVKKVGYGRLKALNLCKNIERAYDLYGENDRLQIAMSVLEKYINDPYSCKDKIVVDTINRTLNKHFNHHVDAGVRPIVIPTFKVKENEILEFYSSRTSVRYYSNVPISDLEIKNALKLVSYTPTACNRQTCKTYVFSGDICKKIIDNQLGDQGWCLNADKIFVITSNGSFFNSTFESKEAYIDGGMYAMNLCMGLHMQKIATCFKMFVRLPAIEKEFKLICNIPVNEIPIVLILAGHYPEDNKFFQPVSVRLPNSCI